VLIWFTCERKWKKVRKSQKVSSCLHDIQVVEGNTPHIKGWCFAEALVCREYEHTHSPPYCTILHFLTAPQAYCTLLHFSNKILADEFLVFAHAAYLGNVRGKCSHEGFACCITSFPVSITFTILLHFTALYCTLLHFPSKTRVYKPLVFWSANILAVSCSMVHVWPLCSKVQ
jgi:hypothetical protein